MKDPGLDGIVNFKQGCKGAFADVYNMHYARVYLFIKKIIDEPDDAQDITAETFVKLWNLRANFETHQHIKAFLFTTARNACMDYLRSRQRQLTNKKELSYFLVGYEDASFLQDEIKVEVWYRALRGYCSCIFSNW